MISDRINEFYPRCMKRCVSLFFSFCILRSNGLCWNFKIIRDGQRTDLFALQAV